MINDFVKKLKLNNYK